MNTHKSWLKPLMRVGFVANGIIYAVIGILAVQTAVGWGGQTTGKQGALASISSQPFGQFLLGLIGVGFIGLMIWYFIRSYYDPDRKGNDATGTISRIGFGIAAVGYGGFAYSTFRTLTTNISSGESDRVADWTATLMQQPFGVFLVGFVGAIIIGIGGYQLYKAYATKFREKLNMSQMTPTETKWSIRTGRFGIAARAVVFFIIGSFLIQAAMQANPQEAGGVAQALQELATQPYGPWLLGFVALGFVAYGLYSALVLARYRHMHY